MASRRRHDARAARTRTVSKSRAVRILHAVVAQERRSLRFTPPDLPPGHLSLVTGGNRGIGAAVTAGLQASGSTCIVAARKVPDDLRPPVAADGVARTLRLDLADLDEVAASARRLLAALAGRRLDVVVLNAGIAPRAGATSAQGHELAYAVNVAGHHVLFDLLRTGQGLAEDASVVILTGDILVLARDCTPSLRRPAGLAAYARSKLGTLWLARALATRYPLRIVAVHPGVVRSGLVGPRSNPLTDRLRITPELSAQTVLAAALDPTIPTGAYLHNTLGVVHLKPDDPASNDHRAARFMTTLDALCAPWLQ